VATLGSNRAARGGVFGTIGASVHAKGVLPGGAKRNRLKEREDAKKVGMVVRKKKPNVKDTLRKRCKSSGLSANIKPSFFS